MSKKATQEQAKAAAEIIKAKCGHGTDKQEAWFRTAAAFLQGDGSYAVDICVHSLAEVPGSVRERFMIDALKDVLVYFRVVIPSTVYDFEKMDREAAELKKQKGGKKRHEED